MLVYYLLDKNLKYILKTPLSVIHVDKLFKKFVKEKGLHNVMTFVYIMYMENINFIQIMISMFMKQLSIYNKTIKNYKLIKSRVLTE